MKESPQDQSTNNPAGIADRHDGEAPIMGLGGPLASGPHLAGAVGESNHEGGEATKRCSKCGIVKTIGEFQSRKRNGLDKPISSCRVCRNEYEKLWRDQNKQTDRSRHKRWSHGHPIKIFDQSRRSDARHHGVQIIETFSIVDIYNRDAGICQLCRLPVDDDLKYPHPESKSLDHIVPMSIGGVHTMENVQLSHLRCNLKANVKEERARSLNSGRFAKQARGHQGEAVGTTILTRGANENRD